MAFSGSFWPHFEMRLPWLGPAPKLQLPQKQAGFDRLAQPHVVGDELVDARHYQSLAEWLHLIRLRQDACAERYL